MKLGGRALGGGARILGGWEVGLERGVEKRERVFGGFGAQVNDLGHGGVERSVRGGEEPLHGAGEAGGNFYGT